MNIPKEHIKLLRKDIEVVTQRLHRLGNILILAEEDELTEQCGVNTSSTFNTPPKEDGYYIAKMKDMAARLDQASRPTPEHIRMAVDEIVANTASEEEGEPNSYYELDPETRELVRREGEEPKEGLEKHIVPMLDQLEEDEEPREPNPVEKLIDKVMKRELPDIWERLAKDAQEFLDVYPNAILHELGHILLQRMHEDDIEEVMSEFAAKLREVTYTKTD